MREEFANHLGSFQDHIDTFDRAYRSLVQDHDTLASEIKSLNSMWTGEAHSAFVDRCSEDDGKVQSMIDYIKEILSDMRYAKTEYSKCEEKVSGLVGSMKI